MELRLGIGLMTACTFLLLGATLSALPEGEDTCDMEVRFFNNKLEWRCFQEGQDCEQCGIAGECTRHPASEGAATVYTCRCVGNAGYSEDTCYAEVHVEEGSASVECYNNSDPCNCSPPFPMGEPYCQTKEVTGTWARPCWCKGGKEDADNPN